MLGNADGCVAVDAARELVGDCRSSTEGIPIVELLVFEKLRSRVQVVASEEARSMVVTEGATALASWGPLGKLRAFDWDPVISALVCATGALSIPDTCS
mmetsp:Transcript_28192/g.51565  ORF Transcript_28192/g.51565 Transcript_28192/m.51565 type:complete len:99 (-) Transcript_28192:86-382(-)